MVAARARLVARARRGRRDCARARFHRASPARASPRDRRRCSTTRLHAPTRLPRKSPRCPNSCAAPRAARIPKPIATKAIAGVRISMPTRASPCSAGRQAPCCWKARSVAMSMPTAVADLRAARTPPLPGVDAVNAFDAAGCPRSPGRTRCSRFRCRCSRAGCCRAGAPRAAALRVPYGAHIDKIAAAGSGHALRGRGAGLLAWLAWIALCLAVRAPAATRPAHRAAASRARPDARRRSVRQHERRGHGTRRPDRRSPHRREGRARRLPRSPRRRSRRPARLRPTRVHADAVDARPDDGAPAIAGQRRRPRRSRDRARRRARARGEAPAVAAVRPARRDPAHRRREHRRRARSRESPPNSRATRRCACTPSRSAAKAACRCSASACPARAMRRSTKSGLQRIAQLTGGRFFRARDTESLAGIYAEIDRLEPIRRPGQAVRPRIERYPLPLAIASASRLLGCAGRCGGAHEHVAGRCRRCISCGRMVVGAAGIAVDRMVVVAARTTRQRVARVGRCAPAAAPARAGIERRTRGTLVAVLLAFALAVLALAGPAWRRSSNRCGRAARRW